MLVSVNKPIFGYAMMLSNGSATVSFRDAKGSGVSFFSDEPYDLLTCLRNAADKLESELNQSEPEPEPTPPPHRLDARTRSVDIEDVTAGDQIRVGGWWHRVAEINERRHGVTVKTTRNEWFAFDHGDRVTVGIGGDNE